MVIINDFIALNIDILDAVKKMLIVIYDRINNEI